MKRLVSFFAGLALCATSFGQITGTGGTENFTGITQNDGTLLVFPADLAGWSQVRGGALPATNGAQIDNAISGVCDGAAFAGTKPADTADLRILKSGGATNQLFSIAAPVITGNKATYTYYIAVNGQPPQGTVTQLGRYLRTGVAFPNSGIEGLAVGIAICPGPTDGSATGIDAQVFYGAFATAGGYAVWGLSNNVGAGNADGNDLPLSQWGKCEIALDLNTMTAVCKFQDTTIETVDLTFAATSLVDPPTTVTLDQVFDHQFYFGAGSFSRFTTTARNAWIDDVSVTNVQNTRPEAPVNLSATAVPNTIQVNLDWDNVAGASGYNVYRSTTAGSGYVRVNTSPVTPSDYIDTGVTSGTTYYYVVSAVGPDGLESAFSNEDSARPQLVSAAKKWINYNR